MNNFFRGIHFFQSVTNSDASCTTEQDYRSASPSLAPPYNMNRKISRDTTPHIDNYRTGNSNEKSINRPTLTELYDPTTDYAAEVLLLIQSLGNNIRRIKY